MVSWQGTIWAEVRRHSRQLWQRRSLAERAAASPFTELRTVMQDELKPDADCLKLAERSIRPEVRESGKAMTATVAALNDRLMGGSRPQ